MRALGIQDWTPGVSCGQFVKTEMTPLMRLDVADRQISLPLATSGIQRYVWESRFGEILIEVIGNLLYVNGQVVETKDQAVPASR